MICWSPPTLLHLSNDRGGWGMICKRPGAILHLVDVRGMFCWFSDMQFPFFCTSGEEESCNIDGFTGPSTDSQKKCTVNLVIANSGNNTACSTTFYMPSCQNWQ